MFNMTVAMIVAALITLAAQTFSTGNDIIYTGIVAIFMTGAAICHSVRNLQVTVMVMTPDQFEQVDSDEDDQNE